MKQRNDERRRRIKEDITTFHHWELEGPIDTVIGHFETIKEDAETSGFEDISVDYERNDYDIAYVISGKRFETDKELEKRLRTIEKQRTAQKGRRKKEKIEKEVKEQTLYKELKKKYG